MQLSRVWWKARTESSSAHPSISLHSTIANYEGTHENYVIASSSVATLRRTTMKLCDYNETNRDCVPTGKPTLTAGDTVDFNFIHLQTVFFYYAIIAPKKPRSRKMAWWSKGGDKRQYV